MAARLHPLGFIGIGISAAMLVLMVGSADGMGWWPIVPPLRYAIMGMMIAGIVMYTAATISRSKTNRDDSHATRSDQESATADPGR